MEPKLVSDAVAKKGTQCHHLVPTYVTCSIQSRAGSAEEGNCLPVHTPTGRNACCCRCQYGSLMLFQGVNILSMQLCGPEKQKPGSRNRSNCDAFVAFAKTGR
jgi:hypothetical protein